MAFWGVLLWLPGGSEVLREKGRSLNSERLGEGGRVIVSQILTFTLLSFLPSCSFLLIIIFFPFDSLIPSIAVLGSALREDSTLLPRAAVSDGYPMPADRPWATLCLSSWAVRSLLPGL